MMEKNYTQQPFVFPLKRQKISCTNEERLGINKAMLVAGYLQGQIPK